MTEISSGKPQPGKCSYKTVCKKCNLVAVGDRPGMCKELECGDYTPCVKCERNLTLSDQGVCKYCLNASKKPPKPQSPTLLHTGSSVVKVNEKAVPSADDLLVELPEDFGSELSPSVNPGLDMDSLVRDSVKVSKVTLPGTPPSHYDEDAIAYYRKQWNEYSGYYTDPTVHYVVHQIIIIEIELSIVTTTLSQFISDETVSPRLEARRDKLIKNLSALRRQLPEKDALELSDDEKSMGMIYQKYLEEIGKSSDGRVRRVLTPDAFALAPILHYPVDCTVLLKRLGYSVEQAVDAASKVSHPPFEDPVKAAEFYGFRPNELFASEVSREFEETVANDQDELDDTSGILVE